MLGKMLVLATVAHDGQQDKGGQPYILHPLKVMHYLKTEDEELQCIALGHDLLEDTLTTRAELEHYGFSDRVIRGIEVLTRTPNSSYEEYKIGVLQSYDAMRVKKADLRHNTDIRRLKGVTTKDTERMMKYHRFYLEIEAELSKRQG